MFLIPIGTDAPLYHFPYATIGLIVANIFCFAATGFGFHEDRLQLWTLEYGNGINPLEWISSAFAHGGFGHLIGNMIFLWSFGLVVEGKLGWWRFMTLYLGIAAASGALVDVLTLQSTEGACLGASGVIFGLMAISLVWAPKNELHIIGFIIIPFLLLRAVRFFSFDITIMVFSLLFIALNVLGFLLAPGMYTPGLHLIGGAVGFPIGVLYLKTNWVDCEKWDLFAVMSGKYGRFAETDWALGQHGNPANHFMEIPVPDSTDAPEAMLGNKAARAKQNRRELSRVNQLIDEGDVLSAVDELMTLRFQNAEICPNAERIRKLASGLLQAQAFDEAEIWLQEFIDRFPDENGWARVRMAQLLLTQRQRPSAALKQLSGLPTEGLGEPLQALAKKTAKSARDQVRDGVKDAEPEW